MFAYHTYSEQKDSPHILILEIWKSLTLHGKSELKSQMELKFLMNWL